MITLGQTKCDNINQIMAITDEQSIRMVNWSVKTIYNLRGPRSKKVKNPWSKVRKGTTNLTIEEQNKLLTFLTTVWILSVFSLNLLTVALSIFSSIFWLSGAPSTSNCQNTRLDSNKEYLEIEISNRFTFLPLFEIGDLFQVFRHVACKR